MQRQASLSKYEIPSGWDESVADFINGCIQRKPANRLGSNGIKEVKDHKWLKGVNWSGLLKGEMESPYIPKEKDNFNSDLTDRLNKVSDEESIDNLMLGSDDVNTIFDEFVYQNLAHNPHKMHKKKAKPKERVIVVDQELKQCDDME